MDKNRCEICGKYIEVQIFRGTGICSELHRKLRDNDFKPARLTVPREDEDDSRNL